MASIGTVTRRKDGSFVGRLKTLSFSAPISIEPVKSKTDESHPDFRVVSDGMDIGAGWIKKGKMSGKDYVSLSMSAPEFGTLYANLGRAAGQDDEDVFSVIWNEKQK